MPERAGAIPIPYTPTADELSFLLAIPWTIGAPMYSNIPKPEMSAPLRHPSNGASSRDMPNGRAVAPSLGQAADWPAAEDIRIGVGVWCARGLGSSFGGRHRCGGNRPEPNAWYRNLPSVIIPPR